MPLSSKSHRSWCLWPRQAPLRAPEHRSQSALCRASGKGGSLEQRCQWSPPPGHSLDLRTGRRRPQKVERLVPQPQLAGPTKRRRRPSSLAAPSVQLRPARGHHLRASRLSGSERALRLGADEDTETPPRAPRPRPRRPRAPPPHSRAAPPELRSRAAARWGGRSARVSARPRRRRDPSPGAGGPGPAGRRPAPGLALRAL